MISTLAISCAAGNGQSRVIEPLLSHAEWGVSIEELLLARGAWANSVGVDVPEYAVVQFVS